MGGKRFFLGIIVTCLFISGRNGQDADMEELTTILSQEDVPIREAPAHFQFPKDRKPSSGVSKRIIGGNVATANEYPYQVALYVRVQSSQYFCGGTLLSPLWVLTAAHCVDSASYVVVILGVHNLSQQESTQVALNSTTFIVHEGWDSSLLQNDIALIRLPKNVTLSDVISTVDVAQESDTYTGIVGRCLGWGLTILGSLSSVLRYVDTEIITNEICSTYEDYKLYIVDHHICTSGEGFVGSCNGDSGGPLIVDGTQVGIVSFGVQNCSAGFPSVFTRVSEFSSWITENIDSWNGTVSTNENLVSTNDATESIGGKGDRMVTTVGMCIGMIISVLLFNH